MKKRNTIIYWAATGLFSALILMGACMYFLKFEMVSGMFLKLGYPTHIIYPLAIAKILGVVAILSKKSPLLKEWAYAGFVFDLILAVMAHIQVADGEFMGALVALVLVLTSRVFEPKVFASEAGQEHFPLKASSAQA